MAALLACSLPCSGATIHVRAGSGPGGDGTSWAKAYAYLQDALEKAEPGDEVWVAQGVYYPDEGGRESNNNRYASFVLKGSVALYGGFAGHETDTKSRDPSAHVTVLSGDLDMNDETDERGCTVGLDGLKGVNSYHVVTASGLTDSAVLDGFHVTGGLADGTGKNGNGAGLLCIASRVSVVDCVFVGNSAGGDGGAVLMGEGSAGALFKCAFQSNGARGLGGAVLIQKCAPAIVSCRFIGNSASQGGALALDHGAPVTNRCTFEDNSAESAGGGVLCRGQGKPQLIECTFKSNSTEGHGGGAFILGGATPLVRRSSFAGNSAEAGGGLAWSGPGGELESTSFNENQAAEDGGGLLAEEGADFTAKGCSFVANEAARGGGAVSSRYSAITVSGCTFVNNVAGEREADVASIGGAPTMENCSFPKGMVGALRSDNADEDGALSAELDAETTDTAEDDDPWAFEDEEQDDVPMDPEADEEPFSAGPDPVPDEDSVRQAVTLLREAYADRYEGESERARLDLSEKLVGDAGSETDLALRYAMLSEAVELASRGGDLQAALRAVEALSRRFQVDVLMLRAKTIAAFAGEITSREAAVEVAAALLALGAEAALAEKTDLAVKALEKCRELARKAREKGLYDRAGELLELAGTVEQALDACRRARQTLENDPDDARANQVLGWYLCAVRCAWDTGLAHLAKGTSEELRSLARDDLAGPTDVEARLDLANRWWDASEKVRGWFSFSLRQRARYWYGSVENQVDGVKGRLVLARLELPEASGQPDLEAFHGHFLPPTRHPDDPRADVAPAEESQDALAFFSDAPTEGGSIDLLREYERGKWKDLTDGRGHWSKQEKGYKIIGRGGGGPDFGGAWRLPEKGASFTVRMRFRMAPTGAVQMAVTPTPGVLEACGVLISYKWTPGFSVGNRGVEGYSTGTTARGITSDLSEWHTLVVEYEAERRKLTAELEDVGRVYWYNSVPPECICLSGDEFKDWYIDELVFTPGPKAEQADVVGPHELRMRLGAPDERHGSSGGSKEDDKTASLDLIRSAVIDVNFIQVEGRRLRDNKGRPVRIQGKYTWEQDSRLPDRFRVLNLQRGNAYWRREREFSLERGTIAAWIRYEGGDGSVAGKAFEGNDEYSLVIWDGRLGTHMNWPDHKLSNGRPAGPLLTRASVPRQRWCFVVMTWRDRELNFYRDGRHVGEIELPVPLRLGQGHIEAGINSPGDDKYLRTRMATLTILDKRLNSSSIVKLMAETAERIGLER